MFVHIILYAQMHRYVKHDENDVCAHFAVFFSFFFFCKYPIYRWPSERKKKKKITRKFSIE